MGVRGQRTFSTDSVGLVSRNLTLGASNRPTHADRNRKHKVEKAVCQDSARKREAQLRRRQEGEKPQPAYRGRYLLSKDYEIRSAALKGFIRITMISPMLRHPPSRV
jgi:hypothetical protein